MRLALTAGGTGGHIFPALAVLEALRAEGGLEDVRFFGPENRGERTLVERAGVRFETTPAGAIRGRGPLALLRSAWTLTRGTLVATWKLRAFRPDAVFSTGGYASFPCSLAARLLRRPLIVFLPDVRPGWAVRAETRLATRMATTTDAALTHLPRARTRVTGYPVRGAFFAQSRDEARAALGIDPGAKVLLIAGASQGAHAINDAVFRALRSYVEEMTVYHVTGAADYDEAAGYESQVGDLAERYVPAPFRDDLPTLMLAADLAVLRAGASTLGEVTAAALPAILVPGGYAGGHQHENAAWLAGKGAAVVVEEKDLRGLANLVLDLVHDEERLAAMRTAAAQLARPAAASEIAALVRGVAR